MNRQTERVRVRYGETDQMGVVYHANYLRYFECARVEWLRARSLPYAELEARGYLLPVIEAHARYRASARYDDLLEISAWPSLVRAASARFEYVVRRREPSLEYTHLVDGHTVHACVGRDGRPVRLPAALKDLFVPHEAPHDAADDDE